MHSYSSNRVFGMLSGSSAKILLLFLSLYCLFYLTSLCLPAKGHSKANPDLAQSLIQKERLRFEHISLEQGLSQSSVSCILQDRRGFMWFGTGDGLNRYDGYDFRVYRHHSDRPNSLSDHYITSIFEDHAGFIWIGTPNGLNRFDPEKEEFAIYQADPGDRRSLSHAAIEAIYEDRSGTLWIGTRNGLNRFNRVTEEFIQYTSDPDDPQSLSNDSIKAIYEDQSGTLWIGTANGLNKAVRDDMEESNLSFIRYHSDPNDPGSLSHDSITSIYKDRSGILWIGTPAGLNRTTPNEMFGSTVKFIHYKNDPGDPTSLSSNQIRSIYEDRSGVLWLGTWEGGLNRFNRDTDNFTRYQSDPDDPYSLSHNIINSIFEDRSGIFWVGTNKGLDTYDRQKENFSHYQVDPDDPAGLSHNFIWGILEDQSGNIWIAMGSGGLDRLIPGAEGESLSFIHHHNRPGDPTSLSSNFVTSVYEDRQGTLWIGTDGAGLNRLVSSSTDESPPRFLRYVADPGDPQSLPHNIILSILEDRSGNLWIGTGGGGLSKLVQSERLKSSPAFINYWHDPGNQGSLSNNFIYSIHEDRSGTLWFGTSGGGLNRLDPGENNSISPTFYSYRKDPADPNSLGDDRVLTIHEDRSGTLWIGTYGGGLNKFNRATETFTHYKVKHGLPSNVVYAILEDDHGNLWLSTNMGLSKFDPRSETFKNYDVSDGLQSNEYNSGAFCRSRSGVMFFGGVNGFNAFHPDSIRDDPRIPQVVITDFKLFNRSVPIGTPDHGRSILDRSITETKGIELSYRENVFSFEFAALHYSSPEKNQYAYKMEGFDKEWNYVGTQRVATYTNLPPGEYEFRAIGSNHDDVWNEAGTSVRIIITPPFWQTVWFRAVSVLFIVFSIFTVYRRRIRKIEAKREKLEKRVEERTRAAEALQNALDEVERLKNRLEVENICLQDEIKVDHNFENIITRSKLLKKVLRDLEQVASTDATVLVLGESGTGKELFARAIHNISPRGGRPLVKVNCSALPANLIESELFGHEKGAFTGAMYRKTGRFEVADGGTIFLDEIGDLPLELQAKLLRVLQEGEFERLGSSQTINVNVRIIAATNRDLEVEIEKRNFREDLYYRLNVFPIKIPPLRDRKEDISLLVNHFVKKFGKKTGKEITAISQCVLDRLLSYDWPGNVRELENIIERAVILTSGDHLVIGDWLHKSNNQVKDRINTLDEVERDHIIQTLELTGWRVSGDNGAARILGINPKTLDSRMRRLNIKRHHKNSDI